MNISSILNLREGLYLYTELVDQVGLQHGLSATAHSGLWDRAAGAINDRKLRSRDPASSLPVGLTDAVTPVVTLEDFNDWLRGMGSGYLVVTREPGKQPTAGMGNSDVATSVEALTTETAKRLTPIERQDERLRIFRERGGEGPDNDRGRWKGVTAVALQLGICRQALTADLKKAYRREKRREQAAHVFRSPNKGS
jgi:hypothetical protein